MSEPIEVFEKITHVGIDDGGFYATFHLDGPNGPFAFAYPKEMLGELIEATLVARSSQGLIGDARSVTEAFDVKETALFQADGEVLLEIRFGNAAIRFRFPRSAAEQLSQSLQAHLRP